MTEKDKKLLDEFEIRMKQLMFLCDSLHKENILLKQKIEDKNNKISLLSSDLEELRESYKNLKFAKSFAKDTDQEREEAKKRLSKLVREVDKCISILKKTVD